jgi:hypothetical protein
LFTAPSNSAPALNFTTFLAAIWIFPVWGFLPLAALAETDHDPKPTRETLPPFSKYHLRFLKWL